MKTFTQTTVKILDRIYCDSCGECCTKDIDTINGEHEYAVIEATWGYLSKRDRTQYNIELCENCFGEVIDFLKKKRKRILGPFKYPHNNDPLEGKEYL